MKYQSYFVGKKEENISKCLLLKFLPSMLSAINANRNNCSRQYFEILSFFNYFSQKKRFDSAYESVI